MKQAMTIGMLFAVQALAVFAMTLPSKAETPPPVLVTSPILGAGVIGVGICAVSGCYTEPTHAPAPAAPATPEPVKGHLGQLKPKHQQLPQKSQLRAGALGARITGRARPLGGLFL